MKNIFATVSSGCADWASNPPFEKRYLRAIELALRNAWERLQKHPATAALLATAQEGRISLVLREMLNNIRENSKDIEAFSCEIFERPQVGAEFLSNSGEIRKPDIVFALAGAPRPGVANGLTDGIFVECKILEQGTSKNVQAYCNNGIRRFVDGSYAPRMREGMMVAYVRGKISLPHDLVSLLNSTAMQSHLSTDGTLSVCGLTKLVPSVHISVHQRSWKYPEGDGEPGPIEIRHLWLAV
jgi:hypothetical protein